MTKDFKFVKGIVDGTDWKLLRRQKMTLINMVWSDGSQDRHSLPSRQVENIKEIVNWVESIQDLIVDLKYRTENEVFAGDDE